MIVSLTAFRAVASDTYVLTSTNDPTSNKVVIFKLATSGTPSLTLQSMLPTGGAGGASGNAGAAQFADDFGAVVNYGSNTVTRIARFGDFFAVSGTVPLAKGCVQPQSVALSEGDMFVAGTNCAESHSWPSGALAGTVVALPDTSAGQIVVGKTWAAVTLKSGSVLRLPLSSGHVLTGLKTTVTLPANANNTPLGAAFWGDLLGFDPAHSVDSFALVNAAGSVAPIEGPQPAYPTNAPCWLVKGPGNLWYAGNSPGEAISIFFTDGASGVFYKSIPLPGVPTDVTLSPDRKWLAVIYTASDSSGGHIAVYAIDSFGDLSLTATSGPVGVASFNGVAISQ
jgi:hypothetical protein